MAETVTSGSGSSTAQQRVERSLDDLLKDRMARRHSGKGATPQVALGERLASLTRFLTDTLDGPFEVTDLRRMSGGGANEQATCQAGGKQFGQHPWASFPRNSARVYRTMRPRHFMPRRFGSVAQGHGV